MAPELPIAEASLLFQALEHGKWRVSAHRQPRTNGFEGMVGWIFFWSGPVRHSLQVHTVEKGPTMCHSEAFEGRILEDEQSLRAFFEGEGLNVYDPDRDAFRNHVLGVYMDSKYASDWPEGLIDAINAVE